MIAGRKLLLADDSVAVQKVIDLTFTDEGMEVTTVADGDDAWRKLEELDPDVVLADVFMPGTNGYGLCERIKQNERFGSIPVILLVGSFEPFDEAEARRVGADDVVTKPFQSIRQLVSRVGSLVGAKSEDTREPQHLSTLGLHTEEAERQEPQVTVLVEAPPLESPAVAEKTFQPNLELQTADTQKLPAVDAQVPEAFSPAIAVAGNAPQALHLANAYQVNTPMNQTVESMAADTEALLDLDDFQASPALASGDFFLDLDAETLSDNYDAFSPNEPLPAEIIPGEAAQASVEMTSTSAEYGNLSPEAVEAIARRVVELLSDKVVREIAWEVVPELTELIIKRRLDEQKP